MGETEAIAYPLSDDISHCPGNDDVVVLVLIEIEILFHARDECIGDVGCINLHRRVSAAMIPRIRVIGCAIYPFDQHSECSKCQQREIQLRRVSDQRCILGGVVCGVGQTLNRNLLSSRDTSAESQSQPFQVLDGVEDVTDGAFSAMIQRYEGPGSDKRWMQRVKRAQGPSHCIDHIATRKGKPHFPSPLFSPALAISGATGVIDAVCAE